MPTLLIFGAASAIAQEVARLYSRQKWSLILVARSAEKLEVLKQDMTARGASSVHTFVADLADTDKHELLFHEISALGQFDHVLIAHGSLTDHPRAELEPKYALSELNLNFLSIVSLSLLAARELEKQKRGVLAVISSVAGERGRRNIYIYGSAKAGLTAFLSGLRARMQAHGVRVLTIKPGFVDTPMTQHLTKKPLVVGPQVVAKDIYSAMHGNADVIYTPWFWRWVMFGVRNIPERIFKKMSL